MTGLALALEQALEVRVFAHLVEVGIVHEAREIAVAGLVEVALGLGEAALGGAAASHLEVDRVLADRRGLGIDALLVVLEGIVIPAEALGLATLRSGTAGQFGADDLDALDVVPEPATLSLLALGGMGLLRRRRAVK